MPKLSKAEKQAKMASNADLPEVESLEDLEDLLGESDEPTVVNAEGKPTKKVKEPKPPRVLKGVMVRFTNKKGEEIVGNGVEYYVVRYDGKLHYKEASQVTVLPDDWKEGDPIPE